MTQSYDPLSLNANRPISPAGSTTPARPKNQPVNGPDFADTLAQVQSVKFSNHAQKRLESREISMPDDGMARLNQAVDKAAKRGGKESLVLMDDLAFIVNVRERLVVTAMDAKNRGEGVFTQIDSVVLANSDDA